MQGTGGTDVHVERGTEENGLWILEISWRQKTYDSAYRKARIWYRTTRVTKTRYPKINGTIGRRI